MLRVSLMSVALGSLPLVADRPPGAELSPAIAELPMVTAADEKAEVEAVYGRIRVAGDAADFASLSAMEEEFRRSRARLPSGTWKLAAYHAGLQSYLAGGLVPASGCQYRQQSFVARWAAATPRNPAPAITDAALLLRQAWCWRGQGFADSVPADAWPRFHAGLAAASRRLDGQRGAEVDPEYYALKVRLALGEGTDRKAFRALVDEAVGREPDYDRFYFNAVWHYLPQWGGSDAEVESFARSAAATAFKAEGRGMYARIFRSLDDCGCAMIGKAADWPTMKQAMRDVFQHYPVRWNADFFADVSCRVGDTAEGHRYIRASHPETTDQHDLVALYYGCDHRSRDAG